MKKQYFSALAVVGGFGAATLAGVVGCGSGFVSSDCAATRTCSTSTPEQAGATGESSDSGEVSGGGAAAGGNPADDTGGTDPTVGGSAGVAAAGAPTGAGGTGNSGGAGGAGNPDVSNPPPSVISVTPTDHAVQVQTDGKVVLEFSEPLDPATVTAASVKLLDGELEVAGTVTYAANKVTFTPKAPLALLATYTVSVSTAVTDLEGAALAAAYSSTFSVRDGAWATTDAVSAVLFQLADTLPINARGDAMIAWTDYGSGAYCPPRAQWFRHNVSLAAAPALAAADVTECDSVAAGGNAAGVAAVAWQVPDAAHGTYLQQYRAGKWASGDGKVSPGTASNNFRVAVSPSGMVTFFDNGFPWTKAWRTDATGKLVGGGDSLTTSATALAPQDVAFDAQGNGVAVWRARNASNQQEILVSRYTTSSGKWSNAEELANSLSSTPDADHERGAPAIALSPDGDGVAIWLSEAGAGKSSLMSSYFSHDSGWSAAASLSGNLVVQAVLDRPGLVFDGQTFVAAFTAKEGTKLGVYTARFDAAVGAWGNYEKRQAASDAQSAVRMPRLAADSRGNSIVVWVTGAAPTFELVYQRCITGSWSNTLSIPGGEVSYDYFAEGNVPFPLSMSSSGVAALTWGTYNMNRLIGIRIASFF